MCGSAHPSCDCPTENKVHALIHELAGIPHIPDSAISRKIASDEDG
jgi:hypothetical protein